MNAGPFRSDRARPVGPGDDDRHRAGRPADHATPPGEPAAGAPGAFVAPLAVTPPAPGAVSARSTAPARRGAGAGIVPAAPPARRRPRGGRWTDWAELLRVSALFTVPGDALAGAVSAGQRPNRGTALAVGSSLCLYEAGMALNDWADRAVDAEERPERPLPSGRISPGAALAAAGGLTAAGLGLAALAGRPALVVATALSGAVWSYDLGLKNTAAGPVAMAGARSLDLLLGAVASTTAASRRATARPPGRRLKAAGRPLARAGTRPPAATGTGVTAAAPSAALLGSHTLAVTMVSRHEVRGGSALPPLGALAAVGAVARLTGRRRDTDGEPTGGFGELAAALPPVLAGGYAATAGRPLFHAALNPSPQLVRRAVGGGIRAMIPLQAALSARAGAPRTALSLLALLPVARRLSRKVSPT